MALPIYYNNYALCKKNNNIELIHNHNNNKVAFGAKKLKNRLMNVCGRYGHFM